MGAATSGVYRADDAEIEDLAQADTRATPGFVALYRQHAAFTWACLRRLGVPPSSIDDAMQELWVAAHRRIDTLRAPSAAKAWLYGIARRVASHQRRTEGRHRRKIDAWGEAAPTHDEAERESAMIVEGMLASLDERVREAFVLSEIEGWTAPEIARATGANTNTIYWRVRTAKHQLQSRLGDRDLDAEVIQLRDATKPSRKAINHCWLVIVPQLGKAPVLTSIFATWSAAKLAIAGAGVTALLATGVELGTRPPAPSKAVATAMPHVDAPPESPPASVDAAVLPVTGAVIVPQPVTPQVPEPPRVQSPATRSAPPRTAAPPPAAVAVDITGDDAGLLAQAKLALNAGRSADARALLLAHRERFPASKLADLREKLEASCREP